MTRRRIILASASLVGLGRSVAGAGTVGANALLAWNEALLAAARKEATPPCLVALKLAYLHLAIREAIDPSKDDEMPLAVIQAAAIIAASGYPGSEGVFRELLAKQLAEAPASQGRAAHLTRGREAAQKVLQERLGDGATTSLPYIPSETAGQWRRTPPNFRPPELPRWAKTTKPFLLSQAEQCRPTAPPALDTPEYAKAWDEVRRLGGETSAERSEEQTLAARFWSDFSYTETPPGHWNALAREVAAARKMPLAEQAKFFCLLNLTLADTAIACWEAKYHFNTWRPVTAITRAGKDVNERTTEDPGWKPLLNSPPHPEYVSGHAAFSAAAAEIFRHQFGGNDVPLLAHSDTLKGSERSFRTLDECVEEIAQSRLWGGIHFRFSCEVGKRLGKAVAEVCRKA